jgi:hypothetical protein
MVDLEPRHGWPGPNALTSPSGGLTQGLGAAVMGQVEDRDSSEVIRSAGRMVVAHTGSPEEGRIPTRR